MPRDKQPWHRFPPRQTLLQPTRLPLHRRDVARVQHQQGEIVAEIERHRLLRPVQTPEQRVEKRGPLFHLLKCGTLLPIATFHLVIADPRHERNEPPVRPTGRPVVHLPKGDLLGHIHPFAVGQVPADMDEEGILPGRDLINLLGGVRDITVATLRKGEPLFQFGRSGSESHLRGISHPEEILFSRLQPRPVRLHQGPARQPALLGIRERGSFRLHYRPLLAASRLPAHLLRLPLFRPVAQPRAAQPLRRHRGRGIPFPSQKQRLGNLPGPGSQPQHQPYATDL